MSTSSNIPRVSQEPRMTLERAFKLLEITKIPGIQPEEPTYPHARSIFLRALKMEEQESGTAWIQDNRQIMLNRWESFLAMNLL